MIGQVLALQVILPLIASVICSIIIFPRLVWLFTFIVTGVSLICAVYVGLYVYQWGPLSYYMGDWSAPYGIELKVDLLSCIFSLLISGVAVITMPYALYVVEQDIAKNKIRVFYSCFLLCFAGLMGIVITHDIFNIYVFVELSSLAAYSLIATGNAKSVNFAFDYLIIGTIGASFYLFGVGLLYMMTGTLNMSDMSTKLLGLSGNIVVNAAVVFIVIGIVIKAALFPFHQWMVNAYSNAPNYISVFFSATSTKVAIYLLIRFMYTVFQNVTLNIHWLLSALSLCAVCIGAICACRQQRLSHILPYSSVSQIGYIILGVGIGSKLSLIAALLQLIIHSITKPALFMMDRLLVNISLKHIKVILFTILSFSLIGIPLTGGFVSKCYLMIAAITAQDIVSLIIMVIGSVITPIYIWKVMSQFEWGKSEEVGMSMRDVSMLMPVMIFTIIILGLGIYSIPLFNIVNVAIDQLLKGDIV